jgi:hypothetical protein
LEQVTTTPKNISPYVVSYFHQHHTLPSIYPNFPPSSASTAVNFIPYSPNLKNLDGGLKKFYFYYFFFEEKEKKKKNYPQMIK